MIYQVWEYILERRIETECNLRQSIISDQEKILRDNLCDLRSMLAREYLSIIGGFEDVHKFHHMSNKNGVSQMEKDRRLSEMLISMTIRTVWVALHRKYLNLIGNKIK